MATLNKRYSLSLRPRDRADGDVQFDVVAQHARQSAPLRAEDAEVAAIYREGGFEAGHLADARDLVHAERRHRKPYAPRDAVNREIAADEVVVDAGAVKLDHRIAAGIEEVFAGDGFIASAVLRVETCRFRDDVDARRFRMRGI